MRLVCTIALWMLGVTHALAQVPDEAASNDPRRPPLLVPSGPCKDAQVSMAMPVWPKDALRARTVGWTVIGYDLDGSGRAQNATVELAAPRGTFDQSALVALKRSKFVPGIAATGCKSLAVFSM